MTHFVLIPGACHGGWWYDPLVAALAAEGHRATAVTLAGLDVEARLDELPGVDLDTHVREAVSAVRDAAAGGAPVVLVGHSYAGSVISGAADAVPDLLDALVYLDAFLPEDGDSGWSMTNDAERAWIIDGTRASGLGIDPLPFFDDRARPHPIGTYLQASRLTGAWRAVPGKYFVESTAWPDGDSPLASSAARAKADPAFVVHSWDHRHNFLSDGPDLLMGLLREVASR